MLIKRPNQLKTKEKYGHPSILQRILNQLHRKQLINLPIIRYFRQEIQEHVLTPINQKNLQHPRVIKQLRMDLRLEFLTDHRHHIIHFFLWNKILLDQHVIKRDRADRSDQKGISTLKSQIFVDIDLDDDLFNEFFPGDACDDHAAYGS